MDGDGIMEEIMEGLEAKEAVDNSIIQAIQLNLTEDFPDEALSTDSSRGFDLTSIKAQYIKERLNETFSIFGWGLDGSYESNDKGVMYHGKLTVEVGSDIRAVTAVGFSLHKKATGDTYKSAQTDCLSKCASFIGIGNEVFKGNVVPPPKNYNPQATIQTSGYASAQVGTHTSPQPVDQVRTTRKNMGSITEKQLKYLWVMVKNSGKSEEDADTHIRETYCKSRDQLNSVELNQVIAWLK